MKGSNRFEEKSVRTPSDGDIRINSELEQTCIDMRSLMGNTSDLLIKFAEINGTKIAVMSCEGMTDKMKLADMIYRPLMQNPPQFNNGKELLEKISSALFVAEEQRQAYTCTQAAFFITAGFSVIFVDGADFALAIGIQGFQHRAVSEPSTHINLRASREGFIEVVRPNMAMVRRRMRSPTLKMNLMQVGSRTNTDVCMCYLSDKADMQTVRAVTDKLKNIPLNTVVSSEYLKTFLEEESSSLFMQVISTERPDTFVSKLYEGRVGILVDGTPFALILPGIFIENFHTMDDYTHHPFFSAFIRTLRLIAFLLGALLPGLYVALCNFNPEMFNTSLLLNIYSSAQETAFPIVVETLIMYILYEIMREAGLRLPKSVGHAVSIVGGLVIGEITVSAGLMSAPVVLIIAATGLCSFAVPDLYESCMILRLVFIVAGGCFGLFGMTVLGTVMLFRLCSKNAYGVPYMAPFAPFTLKSIIRDTFVRGSWKNLAKTDVAMTQLSGKAGNTRKNERNGISDE